VNNKLEIPVDTISNRPNHLPGGGGALNAGYTPVDALARISNLLGLLNLEYGEDFTWKNFEYGTRETASSSFEQYLVLTFKNKNVMLTAKLAIESMK
jgi:hypothetical protein